MKAAAIIVGRGTWTFPVYMLVSARQPEIIALLAGEVPFLPEVVDEEDDPLTPEQRRLERLMRQKPRPGKRGSD